MYDNQAKSPSAISGYCAPGVVPRDEPGACKVTSSDLPSPPLTSAHSPRLTAPHPLCSPARLGRRSTGRSTHHAAQMRPQLDVAPVKAKVEAALKTFDSLLAQLA